VLQSMEQRHCMLDVSRYMLAKMRRCDIHLSRTGPSTPTISIRSELSSKSEGVSNGLVAILDPELPCSIHVQCSSEITLVHFILG